VDLRRLTADDWAVWRDVRLRALAEAPHAFGSTLAAWSGHGDTEARWRARLDGVPFNVVAVSDNGGGIGQAGGTALDHDRAVELISMWVAPEARGQGVGEALIEAVVRWAIDEGATHVTLSVKADNAAAIRLYERAGFTMTGPGDDASELGMSRPAG
jgi:ribosomal protein S18 acetylase RimI-like enzyme